MSFYPYSVPPGLVLFSRSSLAITRRGSHHRYLSADHGASMERMVPTEFEIARISPDESLDERRERLTLDLDLTSG